MRPTFNTTSVVPILALSLVGSTSQVDGSLFLIDVEAGEHRYVVKFPDTRLGSRHEYRGLLVDIMTL